MPPFWISLELRMMEVVVTTGAVRHANLQSNHHLQHINIQPFTDQKPFLLPKQQFQSTEGKRYGLAYHKLTGSGGYSNPVFGH